MQQHARSIRLFAALLIIAAVGPATTRVGAAPTWLSKLDPILQQRWAEHSGASRVIVRMVDDGTLLDAAPIVSETGGSLRRKLRSIRSYAIVVPNVALPRLAASRFVERISLDRPVAGAMDATGAAIGATAVRQSLGYDGAGVGVAIIDSGITSWHDDLTDPAGGQRIDRFVDFVNGGETAYDDYGHGTHVAGIIAGNGYDSAGARTGIAPASRLVVLKVLDDSGRGCISDVIAALEYAVAERDTLNIRVINLSVATAVYESYDSDPLTLAAQRAVMAGIVVVAAAGNNGISPEGRTRYGGITAPGNAPWVLTVGASSHMGTIDRADDTIAPFSSRGPAALTHNAKPDLVAPGVGIESLSDPASAFYLKSSYLLSGTVATSYQPYLSLSGTSMSAPVVAGTVALMLQANPSLTPNQVKAILHFTAQVLPHHDPLTQGAGLLNAKGAVELARYFASPSDTPYPSAGVWSKRLVWGNTVVKGGRLSPDANAWPAHVVWGTSTAGSADIEWGVVCLTSACDITAGRWTTTVSKINNVVWGTACGGGDCQSPWTVQAVAATTEGETVVWGTSDDADTVVWGTVGELETVVWGTTDEGDTVVWGTSCTGPACIPTIWPKR